MATLADMTGSDGTVIGVKIPSDLFIPYQAQTAAGSPGLCLQDSTGAWWRVTANPDGSLAVVSIVI